MNEELIASKIQQIQSEAFKQELLSFLDYLVAKQSSDRLMVKRIPKFGRAKGAFKVLEDFDEHK